MCLHKAFMKFSILKLACTFNRKPVRGSYNQRPYITTPALCHGTQGVSRDCAN